MSPVRSPCVAGRQRSNRRAGGSPGDTEVLCTTISPQREVALDDAAVVAEVDDDAVAERSAADDGRLVGREVVGIEPVEVDDATRR